MRRVRLAGGLLALVVLAAVAAGCSSVRAWEKEYLADPVMTPPDEAAEAMRELKWLETREGSTGGTGGAGGGCACK